MNLIDENVERESEEKQKKITKIIIATIIVLIAIVVAILLYSSIKKKNTLKVSIDNKSVKYTSDLFVMQDSKNLYVSENGQIYMSVKKLANMLNVGFYNDEFKERGEDVTKCYIKTDNEFTSYITGSDTIYKTIDNRAEIEENIEKNKKTNESIILKNEYEYEYFTINDGVKFINNEIYASKEAIELGFNVVISYDQNDKSVKIVTLDSLQKQAASKVSTAVTDDTVGYSNKKLLKYGYVLVKNGAGDYGVANYTNYKDGNYAISCKYSRIEFIENLGCLVVTTAEDKGKGILKIDLNGNENVKTVIEPRYQDISQLSKDAKLYIIKENGRYGIVKILEDDSKIKTETVLKAEYQYIGLDVNQNFEGIDSRFIIKDEYIPIKRDNKWGIVSTSGKILVTPMYDLIGCNVSENGTPVVFLPNLGDTDAIVFGNNFEVQDPNSTSTRDKIIEKKFYIVNVKNGEKIGKEASEIYSAFENNERQYIIKMMVAGGNTYRYNIYAIYGNGVYNGTTTNNNTSSSSSSAEKQDNNSGNTENQNNNNVNSSTSNNNTNTTGDGQNTTQTNQTSSN